MNVRDEVQQIAKQFLRKVKRSGPDDVMAICPFHLKADGTEERTPSFALNLSKGLFFCHSCQAKGNLFTLLRDLGLSREIIERQYRIVIDEASNNIPASADPLRPLVFDLLPLEEAVLGLLDYCPFDLVDDGFMPATLHHFEIGFDRWHNRVTYPLRDLKGKLVGISGRNRGQNVKPKYKVYTKEYAVWGISPRAEPDKRAVMWNADKVYPEVYFSRPDQNKVVVVEGFKACMWVWQAGIKNVVALLGTYLSEEHLWILERLGAPVYLFLDNNEPGQIGTINAGNVLARSLDVHVVNYPARLSEVEAAQPDSCTPVEVEYQVANAPSYLEWLIQFA